MNHLGRVVLFDAGRTPVTFGSVFEGLAIMGVGFILSRLAKAAIRRLRVRAGHAAPTLYIFEKLVTYGLVIVSIIAGLSTIGFNLSSLTIFAGAFGVGAGLGLQSIIREFGSGLVLLFDHVIEVGDYVELKDGQRGLVQGIGPRAVRIRTNDNVDLTVPNSTFVEGSVINWTLHGRSRRIHVPFTVAFDADRRKVREAVRAAADAVPFTMAQNEATRTQVWLTGFGATGMNFELIVWPNLTAVKRPAATQSAYLWAILDALDAAGIQAPGVHHAAGVTHMLERESEAALRAIAPPRRAPRAKARSDDNDAAQDIDRPLPPEPPDAALPPDRL